MMTRTRIIFFVILAIFLLIVAVSLVLQVLGAAFLQQLFVAAAIFGIGVTLLDFMGLLGSGQDDGVGDDPIFDVGAGGDHDVGTQADYNAAQHSPLLSVLTYLRLLVYFCLGFGPTGWAALASGRAPVTSLLMAIPVGVVSLFLAQALFRVQQRNTDSTVHAQEMLQQNATVTIPLTHTTMGRVRLQLGMSVMEPYALAEEQDAMFSKGETVHIVRVTDECVYVR
jgi:membrane protein implicated in regulation of membrane protease activity